MTSFMALATRSHSENLTYKKKVWCRPGMSEGALQGGYRTSLHTCLHKEQQHQHILLVRLQSAFQQYPQAQAGLCGLARSQQGLH